MANTIKKLENRYKAIMEYPDVDNTLLYYIYDYIKIFWKEGVKEYPSLHNFWHEKADEWYLVMREIKNDKSLSEEEIISKVDERSKFFFTASFNFLYEVYNAVKENKESGKELPDKVWIIAKNRAKECLNKVHFEIIGVIESAEDKNENNVSEFIKDISLLIINKKKIALPPQGNEFYLCKSLFERIANEPVDWSVIYEEMTGGKEDYDKDNAKRKVYDSARNLNKRISEMAGIEKFVIAKGNTHFRKF